MRRPILFQNYPDVGVVYEIKLLPVDDYVQAKFVEAVMIDERWDIIGEFRSDDTRYSFLNREIANCLQVDNRIPLGYLVEDYIEQCPYELQINNDEISYETPEQFKFH